MVYPAKLTPERVLNDALELLETQGPDALNMRALAARLGVQASSLYRHYPDRAALLSAVEEQTMLHLQAGMVQASEAATGPAARLEAAAHAYLTYAAAHPHLYAQLLAPRPPAPATPGPAKDLWNLTLRLVGDLSGDPDDTARTVALWAYLHGFSLLQLSGQLGLSGDRGGFQLGLDILVGGFTAAGKAAGTSVPAAPFPADHSQPIRATPP